MFGKFLTSDAARDTSVTVAGQLCNLTAATAISANTTQLNCTLPTQGVPWGIWPVVVTTAGFGAAVPPTGAAAPTLTAYNVTPAVSISAPLLHNVSSGAGGNCRVSLFGGGLLTVTGVGLVPGVNNSDQQRSMEAFFDASNATLACVASASPAAAPASCSFFGATTPPLTAMNGSSPYLTMTVVTADSTSATIRLSRYSVPNADKFTPNSTIRSLLRWRVRVRDTAYAATLTPPATSYAVSADMYLEMCTGRTPVLSAASPPSLPPGTIGGAGRALAVTYGFAMAGTESGVLVPTAAGSPSNAAIELELAGTRVACANASVVSSSATNTTYTETASCTLPPYIPSGLYTLW